jgi:hypothetical protein
MRESPGQEQSDAGRMDPFASGKVVFALHRNSGATEMTSISGKVMTLLVTPRTGKRCILVHDHPVALLRCPPSLGYNGRTTRALGPLSVKGDPGYRLDGGWRDGEDIQLVSGTAGGVEVIALVPSDAVDGFLVRIE